MKRFFPIIDNGMGLSVTAWAVSMLAAVGRADSIFCHVSTPYCGYAMDLATQKFMESDCDEMVLIDTDIVFKPEHLQYLFEHDEPLVFGLYSKRQVKFEAPLIPLPGKERPEQSPGHLWEVMKTARGFMRAKRCVFERLEPLAGVIQTEFGELPNHWPTQPDGTSEDFAFCSRWRETGGRILIDKRVFVGHVGQAQFPLLRN